MSCGLIFQFDIVEEHIIHYSHGNQHILSAGDAHLVLRETANFREGGGARWRGELLKDWFLARARKSKITDFY